MIHVQNDINMFNEKLFAESYSAALAFDDLNRR